VNLGMFIELPPFGGRSYTGASSSGKHGPVQRKNTELVLLAQVRPQCRMQSGVQLHRHFSHTEGCAQATLHLALCCPSNPTQLLIMHCSGEPKQSLPKIGGIPTSCWGLIVLERFAPPQLARKCRFDRCRATSASNPGMLGITGSFRGLGSDRGVLPILTSTWRISFTGRSMARAS
jgi:hypothetical protein